MEPACVLALDFLYACPPTKLTHITEFEITDKSNT